MSTLTIIKHFNILKDTGLRLSATGLFAMLVLRAALWVFNALRAFYPAFVGYEGAGFMVEAGAPISQSVLLQQPVQVAVVVPGWPFRSAGESASPLFDDQQQNSHARYLKSVSRCNAACDRR